MICKTFFKKTFKNFIETKNSNKTYVFKQQYNVEVGMNQTEYKKFKNVCWGGPDTLENVYVTANGNYWNLINFSFFLSFFLWFFPLLKHELHKNFGGGVLKPP